MPKYSYDKTPISIRYGKNENLYSNTVPLNLIKGPSKGSKKPPHLKIVWNQPHKDGVLHYILETAYFEFMNSYVGDTFYIKSLT